MTTPDAVLAEGIESVTKIIGRGITEQIFAQLEGKKTVRPGNHEPEGKREKAISDGNNKDDQSTLSHFR
jgi:hypothetical protein